MTEVDGVRANDGGPGCGVFLVAVFFMTLLTMWLVNTENRLDRIDKVLVFPDCAPPWSSTRPLCAIPQRAATPGPRETNELPKESK